MRGLICCLRWKGSPALIKTLKKQKGVGDGGGGDRGREGGREREKGFLKSRRTPAEESSSNPMIFSRACKNDGSAPVAAIWAFICSNCKKGRQEIVVTFILLNSYLRSRQAEGKRGQEGKVDAIKVLLTTNGSERDARIFRVTDGS